MTLEINKIFVIVTENYPLKKKEKKNFSKRAGRKNDRPEYKLKLSKIIIDMFPEVYLSPHHAH